LGDTYPWCNVRVSEGGTGAAASPACGYVRKARICSHIATVMLHRRQLRLCAE